MGPSPCDSETVPLPYPRTPAPQPPLLCSGTEIVRECPHPVATIISVSIYKVGEHFVCIPRLPHCLFSECVY
jgi:hypothetical protein